MDRNESCLFLINLIFYEKDRKKMCYPASILEAASAQEFTQQRGWRYFLVLYGGEVFDELQQAVGFGILGAVARYAVQYRLGVAAQHGQFEEKGRIEHHVRIFLIGENPFVFACPYAGPAGDGFLGRIAAVVVVADDAAYQSVVGGGYPVVVVQRDGGQGRHVNLVLVFGRDMRCQFGVQGMDAFQDEDGVLVDAEFVSLELFLAGGEVEAGQFHFFAAQQGLQLFVEQLEVEGVERFIVVVAFLVERGLFAVYEVVVQRNGVGVQAVGHQLYAEAFAEGGFSRGRRPRYQDQLCAGAVLSPLEDVVGYLCDFLLLQGFGHIDEVGGVSVLAGQVEVAHVVQAHDVVPAQVFLENVEHFLLLHHVFQYVGIFLVGDT